MMDAVGKRRKGKREKKRGSWVGAQMTSGKKRGREENATLIIISCQKMEKKEERGHRSV